MKKHLRGFHSNGSTIAG